MPTKLTDEQRVRAAVPDAVCVWGCTRFEVTAPSYMGGRLILGSGKDVPSAWHAALQHHTVQAYERTHANVETQEQIEMGGTGSADTGVIPSKGEHMADTPELPEMDVTEEEKALGRSKVFAMFGEGRSDLTRELINSEAELFCRERQLREAHATIAALRAQLTGPAMEAMVRACAEAVWQMYYEPHNLTENALKERTFEAVLALVVGTHKPLLERIRELEAENVREKDFWFQLSAANGRVMARAEAAEAKVCDLTAAAGAAKGERP